MRTFLVLKPKPGSQADRVIDARSGIVADAPSDAALLLVYYEGNRYGAENLDTYEARVQCAAGRLATKYPTVARGVFPRTDFEVIGTFTFSPDWKTTTLALTEPC